MTKPRSRWSQAWPLVKLITQHHTMLLAAGVAFYLLLALVPALIAVVSTYALFARPEDVESQLSELTNALPVEAGDLIVAQLQSTAAIGRTEITFGLAVGLLGAIWAVSNATNSMVMAIRIAYEYPSPHNWVQGRLFAFAISGFAVIVAAVTVGLVVALPRIVADTRLSDPVETLVSYGRFPVVILFSAIAQAGLYWLVVRGKEQHSLLIGAASASAMWVSGTLGLDLFVANFAKFESTFGSLTSVIVLMLWFYISALSVLFGAEINGVLSRNPR